jgi:pimeloyl-ACP methyl ester carboxylesterase
MQCSTRRPLAPGATISITRPGFVAIGRGQPVLLLHATMSSKSQWRTLGERLANRFLVVAVDLHGYGDNPALPERTDFTIDDDVALIMSRLDHWLLNPARVHIVGHSYGGAVALRLAQRHPGRVASLALFEPMVLGLFGEHDPLAASAWQVGRAITARVSHHRYFEAAQICVDYWSGTRTFANLSLPARNRAASIVPQAALNFRALTRERLRLDEFRTVAARTLLLGGTRSPVAAQHIVRLLSTALPFCQTGWLEADHMAPANAGERFNQLIEAFVELQAERLGENGVSNLNTNIERAA